MFENIFSSSPPPVWQAVVFLFAFGFLDQKLRGWLVYFTLLIGCSLLPMLYKNNLILVLTPISITISLLGVWFYYLRGPVFKATGLIDCTTDIGPGGNDESVKSYKFHFKTTNGAQITGRGIFLRFNRDKGDNITVLYNKDFPKLNCSFDTFTGSFLGVFIALQLLFFSIQYFLGNIGS